MATITLKDIAAMVGVHPSTVSRALDPTKKALVHDDTRARIRAAADALGYRPDAVASGLRRGRTSTFGVVVADIGNPFIAPLLRGIENNLEGRGLMALIAETQDSHDRLSRVVDHLLARRVDAIITTAARSGDERLLKTVGKKVPLVLAVRDLPESGLTSVTHDDARGGALAADHLVELGHGQVTQLCGPRDISSFQQRGEGFRRRLAGGRTELVEIGESARHPVLSEGRRLMQLVLDVNGGPPTGIFAHNDLMAFGALEVLESAGIRCPEDVAVIGYNDTPMTAVTNPPLTTIRLPAYQLGRMAADIAVTLTENQDRTSVRLSLPPELVVRDSTIKWVQSEPERVMRGTQ